MGAVAGLVALATWLWSPPLLAQPWLPPPEVHFEPGMNDEELRATIRELVPALTDPAADAVTRAEGLRDWLHAFLPVADARCDLWNLGADHNNDRLGKLFNLAERRLGGYYCGGQAEIARKVYELMGYETFTMNFGVPDTGATHVTTFVKLPVNGEDRWTIQDVYFNFTLRHPNGSYLGFEELIDALAADDLSQVVVDEVATARTPALYTRPDRVPRINRRYGMDAECVREWDGFEEFRIRWDFAFFRTTMFDVAQELRARLDRENPLYLFVMPLGYKGPDAVARLENRLRAAQATLLQKLGIPPAQLTVPIQHPPKVLEPID